MIVRDATPEDIAEFYGEPAVPVRLVYLHGDGFTAIGGLVWLDDGVYAVSAINGERKPMQLMRAARAVRYLIENAGVDVYATPAPDEPSADSLLRHCGFKRDGDRYVYAVSADGGRVRGAAGTGDLP